jgi:hypothetical protein
VTAFQTTGLDDGSYDPCGQWLCNGEYLFSAGPVESANRNTSGTGPAHLTEMVMTRNNLIGIGLAGLGCLTVSLLASSAERLNIKTGLWEITSTTQMSGTPQLPKELTANLTPQQRAKMEADFKAASKDPKKDVDRSCITQKDVENPFHGASENCKQSIIHTTRTTQEVRLVCAGEPKGSGFIRINTPTPETMTGVMDIKMGEGADALTLKANLTGRWLGADCGEEADTDSDDSEDPESQAPGDSR